MPAKTKPHSVSERPRSSRNSDQPKPEPTLARHARKCAICNHPDRELIEDDFVSWRSEDFICREFFITSRSAIYRHAVAAGLLQRRRRNLRGVAERIIEHVGEAPPSAHVVLRALRIYSQITEDGQWLEPPKRSIVTHIHITRHESASPSRCHSEPGALPVRDGGEEPAAYPTHVGASSSPSSPDPEIATVVASSGLENHTPEQNVDCDLDYLPPWARRTASASSRAAMPGKEPHGVKTPPNANEKNNFPNAPGPEILIGTQNASPEALTGREYSP